MSHRDSRIRRDTRPRGDPGHDLKGNAMAGQMLGLLAASTENQRISPLSRTTTLPAFACSSKSALI